jgi:hypothetical protein
MKQRRLSRGFLKFFQEFFQGPFMAFCIKSTGLYARILTNHSFSGKINMYSYSYPFIK